MSSYFLDVSGDFDDEDKRQVMLMMMHLLFDVVSVVLGRDSFCPFAFSSSFQEKGRDDRRRILLTSFCL
jgi:hypothetical protein